MSGVSPFEAGLAASVAGRRAFGQSRWMPLALEGLRALGPRRVRWGARAFNHAPRLCSADCFCSLAYARNLVLFRIPKFSGYQRLGLTQMQHEALNIAYENFNEAFRDLVDDFLAEAP